YYLGSNVSYNLKKLVEMGFISHQKSEHDRRSVRVSLTEKGRMISELIDNLYDEQLEEIMGDELLGLDDMRVLRKNLRNLERYWSDQLRFT
ncbi:MAG: MarR family transcriptional regulator, partial [Sphingomonadales bacterium]|nr:MarR family transcriptional regulator [Sphingomonadales bacterium]